MELNKLKEIWPSITDGIQAIAEGIFSSASSAHLCWVAWNANHPNPIPSWKQVSSCAAQPTSAELVYYQGWTSVRNALQWVMTTGMLDLLPTQKECEDVCKGIGALKEDTCFHD